MFDMGFGEIVVIALLALVILGPERLPTVIRTLSHWRRMIATTQKKVKVQLEKELQLDSVEKALHDTKQTQFDDLSEQVQQQIQQANQIVKQFSLADSLSDSATQSQDLTRTSKPPLEEKSAS
ncbi:Sec-independent protein translocase protein TatB [Thaumasiovibrio subtropicus]|uniref:Sec-independent protein translocase protein TatB n=1 Tax=Thaumasiovibrio subtropicus TaxID=1891207 RepID=UPI00131AFAB8|nr:Sec-independent protein translocase protein TatB [Thaumasiovibrio subtropicus]